MWTVFFSDTHKSHKSLIAELGDAIRGEKRAMENMHKHLDEAISNVADTIRSRECNTVLKDSEQVIRNHIETVKKRVELEGEMLIQELYKKCKVKNKRDMDIQINNMKTCNNDARCVLTEVEYTLGQSDTNFIEAVKNIKQKAATSLAILGDLTKYSPSFPAGVRFLPAKPLPAGKLVGVLDSKERPHLMAQSNVKEDWEVPNPEQEETPKPIPPRPRRPEPSPRGMSLRPAAYHRLT